MHTEPTICQKAIAKRAMERATRTLGERALPNDATAQIVVSGHRGEGFKTFHVSRSPMGARREISSRDPTDGVRNCKVI